MKYKSKMLLAIVTVSMLILSAFPVSAATSRPVSKKTDTYYYRYDPADAWQKVDGVNPAWTKYYYNNKKDLTKINNNNWATNIVKYEYKYKKGKKDSMTTDGGSWSGENVFYNKNGRRTKSTHETCKKKYTYNSKGFVKTITYDAPWVRDSRFKESWSYKYNGKLLKKGTHKIMSKDGTVIEKQIIDFNSKGLPVKLTTSYNDNRNTEVKTFTYKYSKGLVKSVVTESALSKVKSSFTYNNKIKINADRYRMMMTDILLDADFYGDTGPGTWY